MKEFIQLCVEDKNYILAINTFSRFLNCKQRLMFAIYATKLILPIWDKVYSNDKIIHTGLDIAQDCLDLDLIGESRRPIDFVNRIKKVYGRDYLIHKCCSAVAYNPNAFNVFAVLDCIEITCKIASGDYTFGYSLHSIYICVYNALMFNKVSKRKRDKVFRKMINYGLSLLEEVK